MSKTDLAPLMRQIGYRFEAPKLLEQALTHRSAAKKNNERLEFLGDSLLSCMISLSLYTQFPEQTEGQLTRLRANLVKGDTLACIASEIQLGQYLVLGPGELRSGGHRRASILADALEAIFAAVYLDGGFEACQRVILALYHSRFESSLDLLNLKDAKTQLQELLQARKCPLPEYTLISQDESIDPAEFHVSCHIPHVKRTETGMGETRRKAEQMAAQKLLDDLMNYPVGPRPNLLK